VDAIFFHAVSWKAIQTYSQPEQEFDIHDALCILREFEIPPLFLTSPTKVLLAVSLQFTRHNGSTFFREFSNHLASASYWLVEMSLSVSSIPWIWVVAMWPAKFCQKAVI
jgi:hypothetical protein